MDSKTEKNVDQTNEELIVDGDLYLIKTISRYPILWDRKNFDSDLRNEVWMKLSKKLKIKLEWLKKRWSYLREQYVRHLKQINNLESDRPSKRNYKYFNEMSFLANHVQIRNGNYQDVIFHNAYNPTKIDADNRIEADGSNNDIHENEKVDFVITENEIEAYTDDDDLGDNLFVELSDEEKDYQIYQNDSSQSDLDLDKSSTLVTPVSELYNRNASNITTKQKKTESVVFEDINTSEMRITEELPVEETEVVHEHFQVASKASESRCEDVIFGELVTSMLKKMDSPNRKRAKKEILNILLS